MAGTRLPSTRTEQDLTVIRTPDQRLRVFISSTLQELAPERAAVREAVSRLRLSPIMFELGARPHPPRNLYRAYLQQSDIFLGIYWQRYGWVAPDMDVSGLEDEYNLSGGMPSLIYIKSPAPEREPRLKELIARIQVDDRVSYKYFSTPEELRDLVLDDLAIMLTESFEVARIGLSTGPLLGIETPTATEPTPVEEPAAPTKFNNLPLQRSSLVGREEEVAAAHDLLTRPDVGLVTMTGPGGTGKTRLAMEVAAGLVDNFEHGVCFVALAAVTDPDLVPPAISQTLRVPETTGRPSLDSLTEYLSDKQMLLVLDNFEQIVDAAPVLVHVLEHCPGVKVLVTSRSSLHVRDEKELPVPPLDLPGQEEDGGNPGAVAGCSAVALFVERAQGVKPDFALTGGNVRAVAEICRRLDGLPLAIELAAARIKLLTPQAMLSRLERRLSVLVGGARDLPARQQTMKSTIEWSYDLLDAAEQKLFARLAVFAGGCTLEAAEVVCNAHDDLGADLLDLLSSLVDKSLIRLEERPESEPRLRMLQTIREYAYDRLQQSGEEDDLRREHAHFYLGLAEAGDEGLRTGSQHEWYNRLETEHANLRASLGWAVEQRDAEVAQRLSASLWQFWESLGYWNEARQWLEAALALGGAEDSAARAKALNRAGWMATLQNDYDRARPLLEESLAIRRRTNNRAGVALSASNLGVMLADMYDYDGALALLQESLAIRRELGDKHAECATLLNIGFVYMSRNTPETDMPAVDYTRQSLEIARQNNDGGHMAKALNNLGNLALRGGDYLTAMTYYNEGVEICRRLQDKPGISFLLVNTGRAAFFQGRHAEAERLVKEGMLLWKELGSKAAQGICLALMARLAAVQGRIERAARLFGAFDTQLRVQKFSDEDIANDVGDVDQAIAEAKAQIDEATWSRLWSEGQAMQLDEATDYALE